MFRADRVDGPQRGALKLEGPHARRGRARAVLLRPRRDSPRALFTVKKKTRQRTPATFDVVSRRGNGTNEVRTRPVRGTVRGTRRRARKTPPEYLPLLSLHPQNAAHRSLGDRGSSGPGRCLVGRGGIDFADWGEGGLSGIAMGRWMARPSKAVLHQNPVERETPSNFEIGAGRHGRDARDSSRWTVS